MLPGIIQIVIALALVGLVLWIIEQIPMDAVIAKVIRIVVVVLAALWVLSFVSSVFGVGPLFSPPHAVVR